MLISLSRMNKIREMDPLNYTVTVEAGCVLQTLQQAAADVDRLFPLSLGAEGTCQIGGNISANAGGTMTLRYYRPRGTDPQTPAALAAALRDLGWAVEQHDQGTRGTRLDVVVAAL